MDLPILQAEFFQAEIETLPEELHTEIFSYLDHASLQTAARLGDRPFMNLMDMSRQPSKRSIYQLSEQ
jgi:hypothetical protein